MNDYLKSLREAEQARYVAKLEAAGLSLQDDPYTSANRCDGRFSQAGLKFEYAGPHFGYFIQQSGVYTQEQLLS